MNDRRIDQLDRTETRAPQGLSDPLKGRAVDSPEFARQIAAALHERHGKVGKAVLRELVTEFVKPVVADPQILSTDRAIAILERLLTAVLPQLKESEEFNRLASMVLGEEIEQRKVLRGRCLEDMAT